MIVPVTPVASMMSAPGLALASSIACRSDPEPESFGESRDARHPGCLHSQPGKVNGGQTPQQAKR
ncbi:MAG: hypothetical protein IPJ07_20080 [Acidobacteria bacterium]|nr:hypothetical protein [Acidobacteriota bacterium]